MKKIISSFIPLPSSSSLGFICFLLCFDYYVLKSLKDALVITAQSSGAEVIPFLKVWVLLPISVAMVMAFIWLANRLSFQKLFYVVMGFFLLFFVVFTFVLYPLRDVLHPYVFADWLQQSLPEGWKGFSAVVRHWTFSLFYVMAECWTSIVYFVLFWGFVNEITPIKEAQRTYPLLILIGNVAAIFAGVCSMTVSSSTYHPTWPFGHNAWEQSLILLTLIFVGCSLLATALFHWTFGEKLKARMETEHLKKQMTLWQSLRYLTQSNYLLAIALITLSFNMVIHMTEVVWKNQILALYPNPNDYNVYMNGVTMAIGVLSTVLTLCVCGLSLKKCGWMWTALWTPLAVLASGLVFFGFAWLSDGNIVTATAMAISVGTTPTVLLALLASVHVCISRSGKYTLYDMTTQMAYIPLDPDQRLKGKAAVDGIGSRVGQAGSSLFYQGLLLTLPTIGACIPYVGLGLCSMIGLCMICMVVVGRGFEKKVATSIS